MESHPDSDHAMKRREPMRLRSDILRGVRLAALAFALVLVGALAYRSVDISARHRSGPASQVVATPASPAAPTPGAAPDPSAPPLPAEGVPNQSVPKQGGLVAQVRGTGVRAATTRTQKAPAAGSQAEPEPSGPTAQPSEPTHSDTAAG